MIVIIFLLFLFLLIINNRNKNKSEQFDSKPYIGMYNYEYLLYHSPYYGKFRYPMGKYKYLP